MKLPAVWTALAKMVMVLTMLLASPAFARADDAAILACSSSPLAPQDSIGMGGDLLPLGCGSGEVDLTAEFNTVRIDVPVGQYPRYVISRAAKFSTMTVGVQTEQAIVWSSRDFDEIEATYFDRQFAVPLPSYEGQAQAIFVTVERATQSTTFDYLRLEEQLPGSTDSDQAMLLIVAMITGMMLMPILFDLVFFGVLRERFILWHAALVGSLSVQLICTYGLYVAFVDVTLPLVRLVTIGSFNLMVFAAVMFSLRFIEKEKLPRRTAKAVFWLTIAFSLISCVHLAGIEALGRWPAVFYFTSGAPLGVAVLAMFVLALRNRSQTAKFLVVGLSPLLVVAMTRVISFILPGVATVDANELLIAATLIEVTATALGVASRFLALKLDRDRTRAEMDMLEGIAWKDALTGLHNRRVIDTRFTELRAQGFDTFALIDLDRFKDLNDRFGHQTGDAALVACAEAMRSEADRDLIALRLGGEEFVLLLRGEQALQRAEAIRQAIPIRIAAEVPALDRLVTASMGVVELPRNAVDMMDLNELYERADTLLYEAKSAGRNRMQFEKLTIFDPAPGLTNQTRTARARKTKAA